MDNLSELEKKIIFIIKKEKRNLSKQDFINLLNIHTNEEITTLEQSLNQLELSGHLYLNSRKEYQLFQKRQDLAIAELKINTKNEAYVVIGCNQIRILGKDLNGAIPGDLIVIKRNECNQQTAKVDKILKREKGNLLFDYNNGALEPYNYPFPIEIHIPTCQLTNIVNGSRLLINISLKKNKENCYNGQVVSIVGHKDDPKLDIKTIATSHGVIIDFSKEAIEQANSTPNYVSIIEIEKRLEGGGLDLRNERIFTIDGKGTKDIDDAVSIKRLPNGNYELGVHIADVSYYVEEDSPLDLDARERSTSIYPYNYVIPMLPHHLSNGICSLNPNEDRMAFSCIMEITPKGDIINYNFIDTIIKSKLKMEYEKINEIFDINNPVVYPEYEEYKNDLAVMLELSEILNIKKLQRGFLSFGDREINFTDENGKPIEIKRRHRGIAEKMIENFMLAANECTADFTHWQDIPSIYRIHPEPEVDQLKRIISLFNLNISIPNNIEDPRVLQGILAKIKKYDTTEIYTELLLQAMKRASYSPNNIGHFGLALESYAQFTAPIRRYVDLMIHRIIRQARDYVAINEDDRFKLLNNVCEHASKQERVADEVERAATRYKVTEYMENHIGETFSGSINHISGNSIGIITDEFISGKINFDSLKNLGYYFDDIKNRWQNRYDGTILYLGDPIEIIVKFADKENGKIEFELVRKKEKQKVLVS